jgi:uncharacterized membrane protein
VISRLRAKVAEASVWRDGLVTRLVFAAKGWLVWPLAYGLALGVGVWMQRNSSKLGLLDTNKLPAPDRAITLKYVAVAAAAMLAIYLAAVVARRIRSREWRVAETFSWLNGRLSFLLALPFVGMLRAANIEKDSPTATMFFIAVSPALAGSAVYAWWAPRSDPPPTEADPPEPSGRGLRQRLARAAPFLAASAIGLLWAAYGYFFSKLSLTNHHALNTRTADLGYYDNVFYSSIHGRPLGCSLVRAGWHGSAHFDPILVILSPIYLIYPRAESILALQSVWLGAGVVPVYLLAREKLRSRGAGVLLSLAYAIYPAVHGANLYEFHSLTLITPLVLWLLYFFEIGATRRYWAMFAVLLLCREDVPLLMCFVGLYALLSLRPGSARLGVYTIGISVAYFLIVKGFVMTSSGMLGAGKESYSYDYYYEALIPNHHGVGELLTSLVTNPVFAIKLALEETKVLFLITLLLPLLLMPLFARPGRVMLIYGLAFCLLASRGPVFTVHFQYTSIITPVAFTLTPIALRQIEDGRLPGWLGVEARRLVAALLGALLVASALVSWKYGAIVENATFRGGFIGLTRKLSDEQRANWSWVQQAVARIPSSAVVGISNRLGPHASNRRHVYFMSDTKRQFDYVLCDEAELKGNELDVHTKAKQRGDYVEVTRRGHLVLLKRK